eukprot:915839-Pyramimonas_sp.AAC.1
MQTLAGVWQGPIVVAVLIKTRADLKKLAKVVEHSPLVREYVDIHTVFWKERIGRLHLPIECKRVLTNSPVTPAKRITKTTYSTQRLNSPVLLFNGDDCLGYAESSPKRPGCP